jgi:hypothetical protein
MPHTRVKCAYCNCDTGASGFISMQRRVEHGDSPIWREARCKKPDCSCHQVEQGVIVALSVVRM